MSVASKQDREAGPSLTNDGISDEFFELLWSKDELNFGPSINIPDTIVFRYGQPMTWYFTAHNGRIKKKNRANLISARIDEAFTKHILGYDVIASFISVPVFDGESTNHTTTIEFLDKDGLTQFLYNRRKEDSNGILQRFIEPKGVKNELIRSIWSPKVCLLERAENIHQLHDHRYGLYERCVTLEGPEYYITSAPLRGPVLAGQIQKICENIVSHISEVTFGQKQVTRLVANFKVDSRDKIWLVYSTSIRLNDVLENIAATHTAGSHGGGSHRQLVNIDNVVEIPDTVNLNPVKSFDKVVAKKRIQCISCANNTLDDMRHPITYKSVIKHYEHVLHIMGEISGNRGLGVLEWPPDAEIVEAAGGVGFGCMRMVGSDDSMRKASKTDVNKPLLGSELHIPPLLRYLHPKLTGKSYYKCRKDPLFLYKTATVCEPCYLVYAEFTTMLLRMGGDLSKMLAPDPSAVRGLQENSLSTHGSQANKTGQTGRPSSSDWRAMSSVNRSSDGSSSKFTPSANHTTAKKKSIGLRSSDARIQPAVPRTIRKVDDAEPLQSQYSVDSYGSMMQIPSNVNTQMSLGRSVSMGQLGGAYGAAGGMALPGTSLMDNTSFDADISAMVAERERNFFKEIARNPQLKDQHPLMHLISAHQKLKMADEASGVMGSKASQSKKSLFGTRYGKQADDKHDPLGIYAVEQPYFIKGEIILPSEYKKTKAAEKAKRIEEKMERIRRKKARAAAMNAPTVVVEGAPPDPENPVARLAPLHNAQGEFSMFQEEESTGDLTSTKSAKKHRDFLRDTLKKLETEVDKSADQITAEKSKEGKKKSALAVKVKTDAAVMQKAPPSPSKNVSINVQHDSKDFHSKPASPDNLENFFQLAAGGSDFLPPRSGAGFSAAASRPSTTANSKRGTTADASEVPADADNSGSRRTQIGTMEVARASSSRPNLSMKVYSEMQAHRHVAASSSSHVSSSDAHAEMQVHRHPGHDVSAKLNSVGYPNVALFPKLESYVVPITYEDDIDSFSVDTGVNSHQNSIQSEFLQNWGASKVHIESVDLSLHGEIH